MFRATVWHYYNDHERSMPWRSDTNPYNVLVSEFMLQQTQVARVIPKFQAFIATFPTLQHLAQSPFSDVLAAWDGLGYNRRAKYLHDTAQQIVRGYSAHIPASLAELKTLPGIGHNTASAILAYAYNQPVIFIETNIRSVYIHHFFADQEKVDDVSLLPLIEASLDTTRPREWYWALMDYGAYLKSTHANPSRSSKHYKRQSTFDGSDRQLRGRILRLLLIGPHDVSSIFNAMEDDRTPRILRSLADEGMIKIIRGTAHL